MLERLREVPRLAAILEDFEKSETGIGWRQLAIIDAKGKAAFFNGGNIYSVFKGLVGRDCVAVGNILRNTDVVDAMVQSFEANEAQPLAERLMRAIEAGYAAGGELKQIKSAGLMVVHRESFPLRRPARRLRSPAAGPAALPVGALSADGGRVRGARRQSQQRAEAGLGGAGSAQVPSTPDDEKHTEDNGYGDKQAAVPPRRRPAIFSIQPMTRRCQKVYPPRKSGGGHVPPKAFAQGWYAPVDT